MSPEKRRAVLAAVEKLKARGVYGIKIELEAQMNRGHGSRPDASRCQRCAGDGVLDCGRCDGYGEWEDDDYEMVDCPDCEGAGNNPCSACDGTGRSGEEPTEYTEEYLDNNGSEAVCLRWLMSDIARRNDTGWDDSQFEASYRGVDVRNPFPWVKFARFYRDGSVDSELTITIKLNNPENVFHIPALLESFKVLGTQAIGRGFNTDGAGLHMALLFNRYCNYPSSVGLNLTRRRNYKRSMMQLLPALYFLGATNEETRQLGYRRPQISIDPDHDDDYQFNGNRKYSAIRYFGGALEFRVFDTCYDNPGRALDNVVVMANTMQYATLTYTNPQLDRICQETSFGTEGGRELGRLYTTATHLDLLNAGLAIIKPSYQTVAEVKRERGFAKTKTLLSAAERDIRSNAEKAWEEFLERTEWTAKNRKMLYTYEYLSAQNRNPDEIREEAERRAEERVAQWREATLRSQDKDSYVNNHIAQNNKTGDYRLSFS